MEHFYILSPPTVSPQTTTRVWNEYKGRYDVTGCPANLKATQAYPAGYARGLCALFREHGRNLRDLETCDGSVESNTTLHDILSLSDADYEFAQLAGVKCVVDMLRNRI